MNQKRKKIIGCLLLISFLYIAQEFYKGFDCGFPPSENKPGGLIAASIRRSQFAYWLEHQKFASLDELKQYIELN